MFAENVRKLNIIIEMKCSTGNGKSIDL